MSQDRTETVLISLTCQEFRTILPLLNDEFDPIDPDPPTQEAPEEAEDGESPPRTAGKNRVNHTITSLRLDISAAEASKPWLLLPEDVRKRDFGGTRYPLPHTYEEIKRIADIDLRGRRQHESAKYIYRCRKAVQTRVQATKVGRIDTQLAMTDERARKFEYAAKDARREVRKALAEVKEAARESLTTIQSMNSLAKEVGTMVLDAYKTGREVNGERITTTQALDAMGKVFTHTRGMANGVLDADGKAEAEDELMKELAKASQERIKRQQDGGGTTH